MGFRSHHHEIARLFDCWQSRVYAMGSGASTSIATIETQCTDASAEELMKAISSVKPEVRDKLLEALQKTQVASSETVTKDVADSSENPAVSAYFATSSFSSQCEQAFREFDADNSGFLSGEQLVNGVT